MTDLITGHSDSIRLKTMAPAMSPARLLKGSMVCHYFAFKAEGGGQFTSSASIVFYAAHLKSHSLLLRSEVREKKRYARERRKVAE